MSAISALTSAALNQMPGAKPATGSGGIQSLDFMKLLMTQMRNQNPLEPQTGTEFMGQMAQFSQLEGINKLNQNFNDMLALQSLTQGAGLIGKTVTYTKDTAGNTARGVVSAVTMNAGKVQLTIGGAQVDLSKVRTIEAGPKTTTNV